MLSYSAFVSRSASRLLVRDDEPRAVARLGISPGHPVMDMAYLADDFFRELMSADMADNPRSYDGDRITSIGASAKSAILFLIGGLGLPDGNRSPGGRWTK